MEPDAAPRLTVAIPFYRDLAHLRGAVDSVRRQTVPGWELLICDDGGPDSGAGELVRFYGDPRLRYLPNPGRLGMAGNWNRCLDLARADLVTLLHEDDELLPGYCAMMLAAAARNPRCAAFYCAAEIIDASGRPCFSFPDFVKRFLAPRSGRTTVLQGEAAVAALVRGNFIVCPTVCYRRSVLAGRRFDPRWRFVLDLDFFTRLLAGGETLVGLRAAGYRYRRHADSTTSRYDDSLVRFAEEVAFARHAGRAAAARGWAGAARAARSPWVTRLNLVYGAALHLTARRWRQAWGRVKFLGNTLPGSVVSPPRKGKETASCYPRSRDKR